MFGLFYRKLVCKKTALVIGIGYGFPRYTVKKDSRYSTYLVTLVIGIGYGFLGTLCCGGSEIRTS